MKRNYDKTRDIISEAKKKIIQKEFLSEQECTQLSEAINDLPEEEIDLAEAKSMDIDVLFAEFNEYAAQSKEKIDHILEIISKGNVPSERERADYDITIRALCERYDCLCQIASDELTTGDIPEKGSPAEEFYNALKNNKSAQLRSQLDDIRLTLLKFVSVQSLVANLVSALEPFQKDARSILDRINNGSITSAEEIVEDTAGSQLFIRALECQDLNSDEGNSMLDTLEDKYNYPSRVTRGLTSNSYFLPEINEGKTTNNNSAINIIESVKEKTDDKNEDNVLISNTDDSFDKKVTDDVKKTEEVTGFTKTLMTQNWAIDEKKFGIMTSDISDSETKKLSASVFTSDLRKGNVKAVKSIIQQLERFPLISAKILKLKFKMPEEVASLGLDFLQKKGYLRQYRIMTIGSFYNATLRLDKALSYKDASKFVGVRQHKEEDFDELLEDKASTAYARIAALRLYTNSMADFVKRSVADYCTSVAFLTDSFICYSYEEDETINSEVIAGAFWTGYDECDSFIDDLEKAFDVCDSVKRFILAGYDYNSATVLLEAIKQCRFEKLENAPIYVYDVKNDKYYVGKNEVPVEGVWSGDDDTVTEINVEEKTNEDSLRVGLGDDSKETPETNEHPIDISQKDNNSTDGNEKSKPDVNMHVSEEENSKKQDETIGVEGQVYKFFVGRKYYCAPAFVKAFCLKNNVYEELYDRIAYAVNDPMKHCVYSADRVFDLVSEEQSAFSDALMISVGLRTFFSNQVKYDYNIKAFYNAIKDTDILSNISSLSNVLYKLVEFKDSQKCGMDAFADYHAKSLSQLEDELKHVHQEAKLFYESTILGKKSEKAKQRRFLETKKMLFDVNGDIGLYIKLIVDDDKSSQPAIAEFLQNTFIKEGNTLSEDNIDSDMLWDYIMVFWDLAGEKMMMRLRVDLMSHLRTNILSITTKALQIMIRWCNLVEKISDQTEDSGLLAYKKIRKSLLEDVNVSLKTIEREIKNEESNEARASLEIIRYTIDEIRRCIEGSYSENEKRYFYAPFLLTDDIVLDDNYCPDLDVRFAEISELQPENRIVAHSEKTLLTPQKRLKEIFEDEGDDYGTARLILDYLEDTSSDINIEEFIENIDKSEAYAGETAELKKSQFIGDLELAQSYGQIDNSNSSEDKKEKILHVIDEWYRWACDSSNYGFFERVMDAYLSEIRLGSKAREKDLQAQIETFRTESIKGLSVEAKEKKLSKIRAAMDQQNYTVVEDILAHKSQPEDDHENIIEEDFLKDFLENYDDYYKPVAMNKTSFATLISNRTRNKEERGAKRLADNWLPGGSNLGKNRLVALLAGFGFKTDESLVQTQGSIGKFESFNVKTISAKGGKRDFYTHPIAAFGSGAAQEGFRVVCLNGKYDAAGLIDVMKQIGNAKHTMVLLDFALDRPERRTLARKSKQELGDKLFIVVDRTVMMFMVKNYDEIKANRMLMSLVTPFGYYQPYVWESSNVMPPEIFMGRKNELEKIESPTGANIVYGGRQLGKSALLKKAKADIDRDENGDRAVLIEIKGLDYNATAKKIGHALFDEGVLTEDISTTDWEELSRAIRKRLQNEKNRIQYLLLLLDEADAFIESCEEINYKPFDALKEIQSIGSGRFKFVIAGLRNIVRFKRDAALGNNSVLTHLESMTVKPFLPTEARELMEIPLHYLGLEFPKEKEYLITLILATTNYFPGLIQMYCAKLLSTMRNKDYAGYDEADTPIYEVSEDHIKKVLADPEFMNQIREKFIITLKLDEDNYYYLIALIMAYLYHNDGYNEGYSAKDIIEVGKNIEISKIASLDVNKLNAFMEELKELNVLRNTDENRYLFTRYSFFQMMGTSSEVDDKLVEYMGK